MTRTNITRLLLAAAVAATAACSDSSTGPNTKNPAGTYPLIQIDKKPIPFVIYRESLVDNGGPYFEVTVEVTGGETVLADDGTFHVSIDYTIAGFGRETRQSTWLDGNYQIQGSTITLEAPDGTETGTLHDGNITLTLDVADTEVMRQYAFKLAR